MSNSVNNFKNYSFKTKGILEAQCIIHIEFLNLLEYSN